MEIPVLNRIGDFEALQQSPSNYLISKTGLSISGIARVSEAYAFWKYGLLLLLAVAATFSGILRRLNLFVISLRPPPPVTLVHYESDSDVDSSDDDGEDDREIDGEESDSDYDSDERWRRVDDDFRVRGSAHRVDDQWQSRKLRLRHRRSIGDLFSWPEIASGKSVVKLWDNLGLGLDFDDDGDVFSLHDLNKEREISSFFSGNRGVPAVSASSPAVVMSAGVNGSRNIELKVWDRRVSCKLPEILAEWRSQSKKIVNFNFNGCDLEKLFVGGGGEMTVGDLRKANVPVDYVIESVIHTWWDADAVNDTLDGEKYKSAMARCCDAVRSHLLGRDENL